VGVEVRVLGSLDVVVDGRSVQIGGPKPRALLAVLAARLGGAAEAERFELGILLGPNNIRLAERHLHPARAALGERGFEAAWADGQRLGFHEALAEAGLTGREVSVDHSAGSLPPSLAR